MYRGLAHLNSETRIRLSNTKFEDWRLVKCDTENFCFYTKPISYVPRSPIQSWSTNIRRAQNFSDDAILISKQSSNYLMNQNFLHQLYGKNEREIINFSKTFEYNVYIMLSERCFNAIIYQYIKGNDFGNSKIENYNIIKTYEF